MAQDILQTVVELQEPPGAATSASTFSWVSVLWDLGTSLSACMYQALCDSDSFGDRVQGTNRGLDVQDCLRYVFNPRLSCRAWLFIGGGMTFHNGKRCCSQY